MTDPLIVPADPEWLDCFNADRAVAFGIAPLRAAINQVDDPQLNLIWYGHHEGNVHVSGFQDLLGDMGDANAAAGLAKNPFPQEPPPPPPPAGNILHVQLASGVQDPIQIGHVKNAAGMPKVDPGYTHIDPTGYDGVHLHGHDDGTSALYRVVVGAGLSIYSNAKRVELTGFRIHAGDTSIISAGMDSRGTNDYRGVELIGRNVVLDGASPTGGLLPFREGLNGYQISPDFEDCQWVNTRLGREHSVYVHGPATPAYYRFVRCDFSAIISQHLKLVGRPHTDAYIAQGLDPANPMYHANEHGTPYNGGVVVTIEDCNLLDSGVDAATMSQQRGPGAIVFEGSCILHGSIRRNVFRGPGLAMGFDAVADSDGHGRWFHPDGTIEQIPSTIRLEVEDNFMEATALKPGQPVVRFVDMTPGGSVDFSRNAVYGTGKVGQQVGTLTWLDNNTAELRAKAAALGIDTTLEPAMWDGKPVATFREW